MNVSKRIIALTVISVLMVTIGFVFVAGSVFDNKPKHPIIELDKEWTVRHEGEIIEHADLRELHIKPPARGELFIMERVLTEEHIPGACVYFRSLQSMVTVYLDGELIFSQGLDAYKAQRMPGRTLCYIPLPENYTGKTLSIDIVTGEPGAFTNLGPFLLGNQKDLFLDFLAERKLAHWFGTFLILLAMFQLICSPYLIYRNRNMIRQLFSAILMLSVGTYMLAFNNIFNMYISNQEVNTFLEFLSIYFIPMALCGFTQFIIKGRMGRIYEYLTMLDLALLLIVLALHFNNALHINRVLMPMYALCLVEILPFIIYLIRRSGSRMREIREDWMEELAEVLPIAAMMLFVTFAFIDMGFFLYCKHILHDEAGATITFSIIGGMFLAICHMISFLLQGVSFLRSTATKQHLVNMAFYDSLTGLPNRSSCEREMEEKTRSGEPYTVISMDLDALKEVNDSLGHVRGDEMLATFAGELKEVFKDAAITGRMGGDEFLVISSDTKEAALLLLDRLMGRLKMLSREGSGLPYSVSYGLADSSETLLGNRAYDIYLLADQRMYQMKRERHGEQYF